MAVPKYEHDSASLPTRSVRNVRQRNGIWHFERSEQRAEALTRIRRTRHQGIFLYVFETLPHWPLHLTIVEAPFAAMNRPIEMLRTADAPDRRNAVSNHGGSSRIRRYFVWV